MKPGYKKPTLNELLSRRGISLQSWMKERGISSKNDMLSACSEMGVEPPGSNELNNLFPEPTKIDSSQTLQNAEVELALTAGQSNSVISVDDESSRKTRKKKNEQV